LLECGFFMAPFAYTAAMPLSPSRRSELRAQAHKLTPVVIIGDKNGLTDEVVAEIDRSLKAHELIKVRAASDDRDAREAWMAAICRRLGADPVQLIGKVLVVYRENLDKPREARGTRLEAREETVAKKGSRKKSRASGLEPRAFTRTSRPRSRTPSPRPESAPRRRRPRSSR
jgi:putative YhbY family RNA-binding protein